MPAPSSRTVRLRRIEDAVQERRDMQEEIARLIAELLTYDDGEAMLARLLAEAVMSQTGDA